MSATINWINPNLRVGDSKINQKGVFTTKKIKKGERVAIFGGEIMLIDEIDNLPESLEDYPMQIEERFVIGSRNQREAEDADFFNHCCDPNCGIKGQIFLTAMRDIVEEEEITFDYAMVVSESKGSDIIFDLDCNCGAKNCRKKITEDDWKSPELQKKYQGYFSEYIQEKIDKYSISYNFMLYNEGDIEPSLNKKIGTLIEATDAYIVYLDQDYFVEWAINDDVPEPEDFGKISNGVAHLETLSMSLLNKKYLEPFRRLLGESMARLFDGDEKGAWEILETSKKFLEARSNERARIWYISTSLVVTILALLTALILWNNQKLIDQEFFPILLSAPFGAFGALISIIRRTADIKVDAAAGPLIHIAEAFARGIVGIAGALLVALAVKSKLILGFDGFSNQFILIALCIISGASEIIVPNLINKVESSIDFGNKSDQNNQNSESEKNDQNTESEKNDQNSENKDSSN